MVRLYPNEPVLGDEPVRPPLGIIKLDPRARLPEQYDEHAIGLDVFAFLITESGRATSRAIHTQGVTEIPTGIKVLPPPGYFVQICSRVTLARSGILLANAPAMIGRGFDGELTVLLVNTSYQTQYVAHEHRIAQLTLQPIIPAIVRELSAPEREEDVRPRPWKSYC